jgi:hypothetical protein
MITPTKSRPSQVSTTLIGKTNLAAVHNTRSKESFRFAQEIVKPWGGLEPILEWCKSELQQDWRWQMIDMSTDQRPGRYIFYFDGEQDCLAFTLKWG